MKTKSQQVVLALSCFLAGFLSCYFLMQSKPKPGPAPTVAGPAPPPVEVLTLPTVTTQTFQIDGGTWYQWRDGTMKRTPPPMPQPTTSEEILRTHPGYFDLIDTRNQRAAK